MAIPHILGRCPLNGQLGRRVERQTLQSLLRVDLRLVTDDAYWFCSAPTCPVVYFDDTGHVRFTTDQVRVPIWQKQRDDPTTPICYCFKFTTQMIRDEIEHAGTSTIAEQITHGTQQEFCACPITNPQGRCCLAHVRRTVQAATRKLPD